MVAAATGKADVIFISQRPLVVTTWLFSAGLSHAIRTNEIAPFHHRHYPGIRRRRFAGFYSRREDVAQRRPDFERAWQIGFGICVGIGSYWIAAKYLTEFGVLAPETQTLIWFGATMVGTAFISGRFLQWQTIDQIVAVVVLLGIAWLLFRAG